MKDWAELSICNKPTGLFKLLQETVIYIKDLKGSNTPLPRFMKLNLTMLLLFHTLLEVIGSSCHYLNTDGKPLGRIFWYVIYWGNF